MSYILKVKIYIQNTGQKCYFFNCLLVTDMTAAVAINVSLYSTRAFRLNCCILCKRDELLHMICRINNHGFYGARADLLHLISEGTLLAAKLLGDCTI